MPHIPIALGYIQYDVQVGRSFDNKVAIQKGLQSLEAAAGSFLVLPELWSAGFDYKNLAVQAEESTELLRWLQEEATVHNLTFAGSLPEAEARGEKTIFYNTLYCVDARGVVGKYRKQHLFGPMGETRYFRPGSDPAPFDTANGLVGGLVCYDLRFSELAKKHASNGCQVFVVAAQWPAIRLEQWRTLLQARAIENQAFVAACNRCGTTGETRFAGHSMVVAPDGSIVQEAGDSAEAALCLLDAEQLSVRKRFNTVAPQPYSCADRNKISRLDNLCRELDQFKKIGRRIVFTNGCFDLLHPGHVSYLEEARRQGDMLVVGLNSDASVQAIKGPKRPITNEESRARVLAALGAVDRVVLFDQETPLELITRLMPDVLVKGADWPLDKIVGASEVIAAGGEVINIPIVGSYSTSSIIEKIQKD